MNLHIKFLHWTKSLLSHLFTREFLQALGVFWPSWTIVILLFMVFVPFPQGQDMLHFIEEDSSKIFWSGCAILFISTISWYSCRLVGFTYLCILNQQSYISKHLGRFMGFSVFTVFIIAFLKINGLVDSGSLYALIFLISFIFYHFCLLLGQSISRIKSRPGLFWLGSILLMIIGIGLAAFVFKASYIVLGLLISQAAFTIHMACRSSWTARICELDHNGDFVSPETAICKKIYTGLSSLLPGFLLKWIKRLKESIFKGLVRINDGCISREELRSTLKKDILYFLAFNGLGSAAMLCIMFASNDYIFATAAGPVTWVLVGVGGILGTINLVRSLGRTLSFPLFAIGIAIMVIAGLIKDPHRLDVQKTSIEDNRQTFTESLTLWKDHQEPYVQGCSKTPLIFIMCDGGALRSGYWAATLFEALEDSTKGKFQNHIFSLSGASGGSTGNATYYSGLRKSESGAASKAKKILHQDIFSYTIARMMFNDVWNLFIPVFDDRGDALTEALEHLGRENKIEMDGGFHDYINSAESLKERWIPILCMNTTRIQDASASVISTMDIDDSFALNHRVDVIGDLAKETTYSMASFGTLGARFPYISPGGGLLVDRQSKVKYDYYVDGGYMDNSGAGIVLEMIMALDGLKNSGDNTYDDVEPFIIHIRNSELKEKDWKSVHPLANDLAAPIQTIVGSYGSQTDILTERLQRYLASTGRELDQHYLDFNLFTYRPDTTLSYNWLMSNKARMFVDMQVLNHKIEIDKVVAVLDSGIKCYTQGQMDFITKMKILSLEKDVEVLSGKVSDENKIKKLDYLNNEIESLRQSGASSSKASDIIRKNRIENAAVIEQNKSNPDKVPIQEIQKKRVDQLRKNPQQFQREQ